MFRSRLFWKTLLPSGAMIVAAALVMAADSLSVTTQLLLFALLMMAAVLHARWITHRVHNMADSLADSIRRLGSSDSDSHWHHDQPPEMAALVRSVAELERRRTERIAELDSVSREHAESTALFQAVLRTMVEGVVVLDSDQQILFANEAARPLLDFQTPDVIGRPIWEVARLVPVNHLVERVLKTGLRACEEYEVPRTKRSVAVTADALPRTPVSGAMLVLHDVTELRRLERMRRDFVSNVSHELKTPLTSIQAYADTLLDDGFDTSETRQHFLEKIVEQSERLGQLILDIIHLGKIESEPDVFDVRAVPVEPVVSACIEAHAAVAEANGILLSAEPINPEVTVTADAGELRTILDNLVDNALSYTSREGQVSVRVLDGDESPKGLTGVEVADTGIGIPKDQQARIFERFYRVDRARDRQRGGTGLGLSIVKHLSQLFGGRVEVFSELGVGTRFTVWLPDGDLAADKPRHPSRNLNMGTLVS